MKIGIDAKRYFFNQTGLGNHNRLVIDSLIERYPQHTFYLFSPKAVEHKSPNVEVIYPKGLWNRLRSIWRVFRVATIANRLGVDTFLGPSNELPKGIHKHSHMYKVAVLHDTIFFSHPKQYSWFDRRVHQLKARYLKKAANRIITVSQQTKNDVLKYLDVLPDKVEVIYQDCHPQFKRESTLEDQIKIKEKYKLPSDFLLMVGRLEERKNHKTVIQALEKLDPSLHLVIIGKNHGGTKAKLQNQINELKLTQRVHFLEGIPFQELPVMYKLTKILVYPSLYEGFGIPILEALHQSTQVVTSQGGCFAEVGGDSVFYVQPQSVSSIVDSIAQAIQSPKVIDTNRLNKFDKNIVLQQYADLLVEYREK